MKIDQNTSELIKALNHIAEEIAGLCEAVAIIQEKLPPRPAWE